MTTGVTPSTNKTQHFQEAHEAEAGSFHVNGTLVTAACFQITDNAAQIQCERATACFDLFYIIQSLQENVQKEIWWEKSFREQWKIHCHLNIMHNSEMKGGLNLDYKNEVSFLFSLLGQTPGTFSQNDWCYPKEKRFFPIFFFRFFHLILRIP